RTNRPRPNRANVPIVRAATAMAVPTGVKDRAAAHRIVAIDERFADRLAITRAEVVRRAVRRWAVKARGTRRRSVGSIPAIAVRGASIKAVRAGTVRAIAVVGVMAGPVLRVATATACA